MRAYEGETGAYSALGPNVELRRTEYDVEGAVAAIDLLAAAVARELLDQLLEPDPAATDEYFESLRGS